MLKNIDQFLEKLNSDHSQVYRLTRWGILVLISVFFLFLRVSHLTYLSLDSDEIFSVNFSKWFTYNPLNFQNPFDDGNPPLHFILIKFWTSVFGFSDVSLRSLPLLFFIFAYGYIYLIARDILKLSFYQKVLLLILFGGSSVLFHYSLNIRPYILLVLTALGTYFHVTKILLQNEISKKNIIFGNLWMLIGLYNHYSFVIFFLSFFLTCILFHPKKILKLILYLLPSFLLFTPWAIRYLLSQIYPEQFGLGVSYYFWQAEEVPLTFFRWVNVVSNYLLEKQFGNLLSIGISFVFLVSSILSLKNNKNDPFQKFTIIFTLISFTIFFLTPIHQFLTIPRYSIFLIPFFYLVLSQSILLKKKYYSIFFIIVVSIFFIKNYDIPQGNEDWRGVGDYLSQATTSHSNSLILADVYYLVPVTKYYYEGKTSIGCLSQGDESGECEYSTDTLEGFEYIYYVQSAWNYPYDGFLENEKIKLIDHQTFPSVNIYAFSKND